MKPSIAIAASGTDLVRMPITPEETELVPILLVDDREENLVALEAVLRDPGYRLSKATSGDDALRFLLDHLPALILMDVQMPGLDGYETAAIIKGNPRTRDIPIIFITAINTDERFLHRGYQHGAIDYIYKPFDSQVLRSKVSVLADLHRKTERLVRTEIALRESEGRDRERRFAELELRSLRREFIEQKRYRDLVESLEHGIVWAAVPDSLAVTFVGGSAVGVTGYDSDALLRDSGLLVSLIDERDREGFRAAAHRAIQGGNEARIEHRIRTAGGQTAWFHTSFRGSARPEGGLELRALSVDITVLKDAERTLATAKRRSDILSHVSLLLTESLDSAIPLQPLLEFLRERAFDFCALETFGLAPAGHAAATGSPETDAALRASFAEFPSRITTEMLESQAGRKRIWQEVHKSDLPDIAGDHGRAALLEAAALRSCVQLALAIRGTPLGVLTLGTTGRLGLSEGDLALADDVAYRISSALENSHLYVQAESAIRLRDEFFSIASHELRTPLTPLKIRVQQMQRLLANGSRDSLSLEQLNKTVDTCHRQVERISKLVDDLLDISRFSQGKLSLYPEAFDFAELIRDIVSRFGGQLDAAGCKAELKLESPLQVRLDISRVEQVIVNLLTNAIKYAPGQPIEIAARGEGTEVRLEVRDHGIGIAEEDQKRIFQRFERAVSSNHFGGLGLGLYIVSQILAAHGGRIQVHSNPGNGANFTVYFPLRIEETIAPAG